MLGGTNDYFFVTITSVNNNFDRPFFDKKKNNNFGKLLAIAGHGEDDSIEANKNDRRAQIIPKVGRRVAFNEHNNCIIFYTRRCIKRETKKKKNKI